MCIYDTNDSILFKQFNEDTENLKLTRKGGGLIGGLTQGCLTVFLLPITVYGFFRFAIYGYITVFLFKPLKK